MRRLILLIGLGASACFQACIKSEPTEVRQAQEILENHYLTSPATAKWLEKRLIKAEGKWAHTFFRLDAQNQFGAMVRANLCVIYQNDGKGHVLWDM